MPVEETVLIGLGEGEGVRVGELPAERLAVAKGTHISMVAAPPHSGAEEKAPPPARVTLELSAAPKEAFTKELPPPPAPPHPGLAQPTP